MAEFRMFKTLNKKAAGWAGDFRSVKIYRHRGTWAFYNGDGWMWSRSWGYRTSLAAVRAAAKALGPYYQLMRRRTHV